jgi:serine/threonine protein kinase
MEIVKSAEGFKKIDGTYKFHHVQLIVRKEGQLYFARCLHRKPNLTELYEVQLLETTDRGPEVKTTWTLLDSRHDYYVKKPDLWAYRQPKSNLEQQIRREVEICELLKLHPHPNVAVYAGCTSANGRVSGLHFKRYTSTLAGSLNPGHQCKKNFLFSDRRLSVKCDNDNVTKAFLDGILAGIHHLHSLGIIHNDITPSNIMLDEDGTPVIIDFDSCTNVGHSLEGIKRTHGWHDPLVKTARETNDLGAFTELQTWLTGSSAEKFIFEGG